MNLTVNHNDLKTLCRLKRGLQSVLFLTLLPLSFLSAQITNQAEAVRISEAEVQLQDKYMAAVVQQQIGKLDSATKLFLEVFDKSAKCDGCAFQLSRLYDSMGENQKAIDYAKKAAALDPKNKWYQIQLAESLEKIGKDKDAVEVYRGLIEKTGFETGLSEEMYFRLAHAYVRISEPAKAIRAFESLGSFFNIC